jgi:hypothetical protein
MSFATLRKEPRLWAGFFLAGDTKSFVPTNTEPAFYGQFGPKVTCMPHFFHPAYGKNKSGRKQKRYLFMRPQFFIKKIIKFFSINPNLPLHRRVTFINKGIRSPQDYLSKEG